MPHERFWSFFKRPFLEFEDPLPWSKTSLTAFMIYIKWKMASWKKALVKLADLIFCAQQNISDSHLMICLECINDILTCLFRGFKLQSVKIGTKVDVKFPLILFVEFSITFQEIYLHQRCCKDCLNPPSGFENLTRHFVLFVMLL